MGNNLRILRTEYKLSMRALASQVEINDSTIAKLETGVRDIYTNHIEPLCRFFNVTSDYLLGRSLDGVYAYYFDESGAKSFTMDEIIRMKEANELTYRKIVDEYGNLIFTRILSKTTSFRIRNQVLNDMQNDDKEKQKVLDTIFGTDTTLRKLVEDLIYIDNVDESRLKQIQDITTLIKSVMKSEIE